MAQHDYNIANQSGAAFRADLNNALLAIVSQNSGTSAPSSTFAHQFWADTTTGTLKIRNAANSAWIELMQLDGTLTMEDGTSLLPGLAFRDDLNTGLFSDAADTLGISTGGVERVEFGTTATVFNDGGADVDFRIEGDTNANLFFVDAGNDRIGLGTSSPDSLLDIQGAAPTITLNDTNGTDDRATIQSTGGALVFTARDGTADGEIVFKKFDGTTTDETLRITNTGNVGIGTTTPGSYFSDASELVVADTGDCGLTIASGTSNKGTIAFADGTTGDQAYRGYVQYNHSTDSLQFATTGTEGFRLDSSRRLLVGTSTTLAQGEVVQGAGSNESLGLMRFRNDSAGPEINLYKTRATSVAHSVVSSGDYLGSVNFRGSDGTNYLVGARIDALVDGTPGSNDMPGRLVFSTTADGASSPTERMRISNDGTFYTFTSGTNGIRALSSSSAGTTNALIQGYNSATAIGATATECFRVWSNGDTSNTNNSFGALSDIKLKENIVDAKPQWDDIKALQVRNYNFKPETGAETFKQIGLIAQEVELVSPGLVSESPDCDEDGNDLGTVTKSVNYSVLYMKAVKALQEAMERIETLEAKVAALEAS